MQQMERILFWSFLALTVFFGSAFYSVIENLREDVERTAAAAKQPRVEASVYPGVPAALRERWREAVGAGEAAQENLWMTLRVANLGDAEASSVTARMAVAAPVAEVYSSGAGGEIVDRAESGGGAPVEVRFDSLPAHAEALIFVAVNPDGFGPAPHAADDRLRWSDAAPHHWREVEVTGRSGDVGAEGVLAHLYGLAAPPQG